MKILDEPSVVAWLNEFAKASTKTQYESRIVRFLQATHTTIADLKRMDVKEIKTLFLNFQRKEVEKGTKNNGVLSIITAIRSYLISIDKTVDFRKGQLVNLEADNSSHIFVNGDLKLMFDVASTFEKALLSTAVSQGWEISSFLEQDRKVVESRLAHAVQNGDKFIFFNNTRQKTGVARFCVLNPLAIQWLSKYLAVRKDNSPLLFDITQDGVQKMLYRLAEQSGLKKTGNLRFHNIRKWLMSRLSRCGFNQFQIKFLMGKSIGLSDSTYLQTLQAEIEEKYPTVYDEHLNISPIIGLADTKKELTNIKSELTETIVSQAKKIEKLDCKMTEINDCLGGLGAAIDDLKLKHPDITIDDLRAIKEPLEKAIDKINERMSLILGYLEKQADFKQEG